MQVKVLPYVPRGEHSAILPTLIKLPFVIKLFPLSFSGRFTQVLLYVIKRQMLTLHHMQVTPRIRRIHQSENSTQIKIAENVNLITDAVSSTSSHVGALKTHISLRIRAA